MNGFGLVYVHLWYTSYTHKCSYGAAAMSDPTNPLAAFLPATRAWFTQTLGEPTPPQQQGWPAI